MKTVLAHNYHYVVCFKENRLKSYDVKSDYISNVFDT